MYCCSLLYRLNITMVLYYCFIICKAYTPYLIFKMLPPTEQYAASCAAPSSNKNYIIDLSFIAVASAVRHVAAPLGDRALPQGVHAAAIEPHAQLHVNTLALAAADACGFSNVLLQACLAKRRASDEWHCGPIHGHVHGARAGWSVRREQCARSAYHRWLCHSIHCCELRLHAPPLSGGAANWSASLHEDAYKVRFAS